MTDVEIRRVIDDTINDLQTRNSKIETIREIFKDGDIPIAAIKSIVNDWQRLYTAYLIGTGLSSEDAKLFSEYLAIVYGMIISNIDKVLLQKEVEKIKEKV